MNTTATPFAMTIGLAGALALVESARSVEPFWLQGESTTPVSQYCVPLEETADARRLYCRSDRS
jgi:hypothetical protein